MFTLHFITGSLHGLGSLQGLEAEGSCGVQPIGQRTIAEELVEGGAVGIKDLLRDCVPGADDGRELVWFQFFGEGGKALDVAHQEDGIARPHIDDGASVAVRSPVGIATPVASLMSFPVSADSR
ncbi:MAG: hypothetical protein VCA38_18700 [Roseibacillus sp.]